MSRATRHGCRAVMALTALTFMAGAVRAAQPSPILPPSQLLQPLKDSWPSYSGDYTGQRYSALEQVNKSNVSHLSLAWTLRLNGEVRDGKSRNPFAPASDLITTVRLTYPADRHTFTGRFATGERSEGR